jgi:hypothetical protein
MDLKTLIIERILFSFTEQELRDSYNITEEELTLLSDIDLFELYEEIFV